jgi:hypothetical protein
MLKDRELADANRPDPDAATAAAATASTDAAATSAHTAASTTVTVTAAPAAVRTAAPAAATVSAAVTSTAMAASASCGKLWARRRADAVFVEHIKCRQADVGDFLVRQHD